MDAQEAKDEAIRLAGLFREEMKKWNFRFEDLAEEMGIGWNTLRYQLDDKERSPMAAWVMLYVADVLGFEVKIEPPGEFKG